MEPWLPLFDIFLNNPTPETEASLWLQQSFGSSSSTATTNTAPITASSFLSLLTKSCNAIVHDAFSLASSTTRTVMFIQTLPCMVQSRILSFLAIERRRFCSRDLLRLAGEILSGKQELDFWVKRAARNLLDAVSETNHERVSGLDLVSVEERADEMFESMPVWLKEAAGTNDLLLPWLPVPCDELHSTMFFKDTCQNDEDSLSKVGESMERDMEEAVQDVEIDHPVNVILNPEIPQMAASLRGQIMSFESSAKTISLASEIRLLCLERGGDSSEILGLIEPWKADDETASVLIHHLSNGNEEEFGWPTLILCSVVLPKFLVLEEPASRVLVTAMIEYCKHHERAAEYALLFPLTFRREGINNPICDVITRVLKECLHPAHVSAFCQKLLCGEKEERRFVCLPCHRHLISDELIWTESLFNLFQTVLNHNHHLTKDSVDHLVHKVGQLAAKFAKSLKFGNFLLCLVTKCGTLLKPHKLVLKEAAEHTNTLLTKSILSKLASL